MTLIAVTRVIWSILTILAVYSLSLLVQITCQFAIFLYVFSTRYCHLYHNKLTNLLSMLAEEQFQCVEFGRNAFGEVESVNANNDFLVSMLLS
jgi:hypothetical protein